MRRASGKGGKKSCLFVINALDVGGAERVLLETVKVLSSHFDVTVLVLHEHPHEKSFTAEMSRYAKIRTRMVYDERAPLPLRTVQRFRERANHYLWDEVSPRWFHRLAIGGRHYDAEIAFLEGRPTRAVSGANDASTRTYAWVHTDMTSEHCAHDFRSYEEERDAYAGFDRVLAVSSDVARSVKERFGVEAVFMQNIIDDAAVKRLAQDVCDVEWRRRPALVSVGRLEPVKGYERLVEAAARLRARGLEFDLRLVGDGSERDRLQRAVDEAGLADCVFLEGFRANPYPCLAAADLFVCSSYSEGFSGTVTEALLLGTPVLATECAGMRDLLGESEYGLVVDNSVDGLTEGLARLLGDRALLAHYKQKAAERGAGFSTEKLAAPVVKMLMDDLAEGSAT